MRRTSIPAVVGAVVLAIASPAWAQATRTAGSEIESTKRIELGAGLGGLVIPYAEGGEAWLPSVQARVNVSSRLAVDVFTNFFGEQRDGIRGMYSLALH